MIINEVLGRLVRVLRLVDIVIVFEVHQIKQPVKLSITRSEPVIVIACLRYLDPFLAILQNHIYMKVRMGTNPYEIQPNQRSCRALKTHPRS